MTRDKSQQDIAIIGYHGRFPKSETEDLFWKNLSRGEICTELTPETRWDADFFSTYGQGTFKHIKPWGGFLEGIDRFDALLFKISPKSARAIDPQQRLFIESAWTVLEHAGYGDSNDDRRKKTGLFVGSMWQDYAYQVHETCYVRNKVAGTRTMKFTLANQASHILDLSGPSLSIDNACTSSLMAIHLACQSLRTGECNMAIAGGVNLTLHPDKYFYLAQEELLAEQQITACFVPEAKGYIPGEGVGTLLLKPLVAALDEGDTIYGVIKATATNHNGGGMFFKVPSSGAQADLMRNVLAKADLTPNQLSHIEMSAYGAEITDQTELNSLFKVFRKHWDKQHVCSLGSLKPNIGHLESAAGISQVIKVLLQFKYQKRVPLLFDSGIIEEFELEESPFQLNAELSDWETGGHPRYAAINSFGAGGANACMILEEPPPRASVQEQSSESSHLIVLSARETETLRTYANHFKNFLKESTATPALKDIAYTLQTGRTPMQERLAVIAEDKSEVIKALENYLSEKDTATGWFRGTVDEDRQIASPEELEKSSLEELSKTWVEKDIDWHALNREGHSNKVALPTYPFLHDRVYWIDHEGGSREKETRLSLSNTEEAVTDPSSKSHIINFLKGLITREISLQAELIDENKNLADYGLDSVVFRKLLVSLKEHFDSLSPSLFYKYKTIRELADFLLFHHPATIDRLLDLDITETNLPTRQIASPQSDIPRNKRALYHSGLPANDGISREDLAIIGVSGRYPKSASIGQFWKNLKENKDFITSFPPERLFDGEQTESCRGSFIDDVDKFDPLFFEISPKDAVAIDPQERLFLQTAWEVIEDAGYNIEEFQAKDGDIQGRVGVFLGTMWSDYQRWGLTPSSYWSIPNRVSYFLNLKGPSLAVDSACSSSLTAIYLACESIRRGESKLAIAGGINLTLHPDKFHYLSEKGLAADGDEIKVFTDEGKGYLPGEGVGAILLKPLKDAVKDGDHIHAVVKGIAINHGGKSNGFMAPNPDAQAEVIAAAFRNANVSPESVSYIDVNAVGSATGDAIELETLSAVFSETTPNKRFCALGSLKSGLGHLEAASGISQVTKVLLQFKHQMLLPALKNGIDAFDQNLENSPFCASKVLAPWNPGEGQLPRRAAISSFGAGGSNAHLILEEYRHSEQTFREKQATTHLFVFSARTKQQLVHTVSNFKEFIAANSDTNLNEVAFTLQAGRKAMSERVAIVAASHSELLACCDAYINRNNHCTLSNTYEGSALNSAGDQTNQVSSESENEALESLIKVHAWEKLAAAWVQGASVPWKKTYKDDLPRRVSLPTYPFEKKSYWPEQPASSQKTLAVNQTRFGGLKELTPQAYLTSRIAVFLGIDSEELQEEKPLLEYGLDSINATKLKYELEKELKHDIPLSLLGKSRHLKEMVQQLETNESLSAVKQQIEDFLAGTDADITENPDDTAESNKNNDKFAPFPLTDIQESFLSGKLLGNKSDYVGCHIYLELEVDQLDISRLQASWQVLVEYHDILHTRVSEDGYQQLLEEIPELEIELHHLQDFEANDTEKHLASLRSQMSHQVYEPGRWPLFEIQVTQLSKKKSIIHFSIDEWVVDAASLYLLLSQWFQLYSKNIDTLPTLGFSFREYVLAAKQRERGQQFENNLSYWTNKLKNLPAQPELKWQENPVLKPGNVCFERTRYHYTLPSRKRSALVEQASRLNISLTTLILSLFSETLYANSAERVVFPIVLTVYNRLPVHPQVDMVLGPFISTNIFLAEPYSELSLGERAKQYQSQLWEDLDHQSVSGIRALRELKKQKKIS
ncbi:MAG: condensation domain-containing protein, partial [Proteobacteria bacterium]|nr:condensation domain-containing protein [Pseudomonadota bacterium]